MAGETNWLCVALSETDWRGVENNFDGSNFLCDQFTPERKDVDFAESDDRGHASQRLSKTIACCRGALGCDATVYRLRGIDHELVVVGDGSTDNTWTVLQELVPQVPVLHPIQNHGEHEFGRAIIHGLSRVTGDAVVVMLADESDDCRDVVRYWEVLNQGWDAVFGSRFMRGGAVIEYPMHKLLINPLANIFLKLLFHIRLNDTTNAFKAYRRKVSESCRPFLAPHFNFTVELPLKAIVRGYSWTVIPITWRNRRSGASKLKIREMGSRYLFIALYCWLEKYFSRGDYKRSESAKIDSAVFNSATNSSPAGSTRT